MSLLGLKPQGLFAGLHFCGRHQEAVCFPVIFEAGSHYVAQVGLYSKVSCLCLPSAGITRVGHMPGSVPALCTDCIFTLHQAV
jgi:hypothetical protein